MSAPILPIDPRTGARIAGNSKHENGVNSALQTIALLGDIGGTDGVTRAETLKAFAGRDGADSATKAKIREGRWQTRDSRIQVGIWGATLGLIARSPTVWRDAVACAARYCDAVAKDGRSDDAAFNAVAGGAVFPSLIGQMRAEMTPLPPTSFERLFSPVIGASIPPGVPQYQAVRHSPVGNPAIGSGIASRDIPIMRVGPDQELRNTAWLVLAAEQSYVAGLQAAIPGSPIVGLNQIQARMRMSMDFGANRLQWYGEPQAQMVGLLDDPALLRSEIADGTATLASNGTTIIDAIVDALQDAVQAGAGLYEPTMIVFSRALVVSLCKNFNSSAGMTDKSRIEYLRTSVIGETFPGMRFEIASELDDIGGNGTTQTGKHGILLTRSDEFGVHRVPILPTTTLPIVEGGVIQTAYMVAQIGRPWISGLGMNHLITIKES